MADRACVFSIKSGSCTLFIWETIILMAQKKLMESHLDFFFPGEVSERPVLKKCVRLLGRQSKTIQTLSVPIHKVLIGDEGLTQGYKGARALWDPERVSARILKDGFPRDSG